MEVMHDLQDLPYNLLGRGLCRGRFPSDGQHLSLAIDHRGFNVRAANIYG
jgi:hypothetical protein